MKNKMKKVLERLEECGIICSGIAFVIFIVLLICVIWVACVAINAGITYLIWNVLVKSVFEVPILNWSQCAVIGFILTLFPSRNKTIDN